MADFLRTLSVQPFYVSFIDLVLFLPAFLPNHLSHFPTHHPSRFTRHPFGAATPCQDVKAVVKRRASAINHSRSRYYAEIFACWLYIRTCMYTCVCALPRWRVDSAVFTYGPFYQRNRGDPRSSRTSRALRIIKDSGLLVFARTLLQELAARLLRCAIAGRNNAFAETFHLYIFLLR